MTAEEKTDGEVADLLSRAATSGTVRRARERRGAAMTTDAYRTTRRCLAQIDRTTADRFVASCDCGWATGPLLTAMQANAAARDHDGGR